MIYENTTLQNYPASRTLSACTSTHNRQIAEQNRQGIDDALSEAATVSTPQAESLSAEILDYLMPRSIYQSINNGVCAGSMVINNTAFAGFSIDVQSRPTTHFEGDPAAGTIVNYRLTAIANIGAYGSLDPTC